MPRLVRAPLGPLAAPLVALCIHQELGVANKFHRRKIVRMTAKTAKA